jgi:hypothetical protein
MLCIELTGNLGLEVQTRLREEYQYPLDRFYYWRGRDDKATKRRGISIGWETNSRTRDLMFGNMRTAIRDKAVMIYDSVMASQIASATMLETGWAIKKGHDDVLCAAMIGWTCRMQWPPRRIVDKPTLADNKMKNLTIEAPWGIQKDVWGQRNADYEAMWQPKHKDPLDGIIPRSSVIGGYF